MNINMKKGKKGLAIKVVGALIVVGILGNIFGPKEQHTTEAHESTPKKVEAKTNNTNNDKVYETKDYKIELGNVDKSNDLILQMDYKLKSYKNARYKVDIKVPVMNKNNEIVAYFENTFAGIKSGQTTNDKLLCDKKLPEGYTIGKPEVNLSDIE